uniref:Histidine-specific methyltransferase SAM-dependent domain-containing protein n=1 Tax=Branchiostoma floridae TaxID=7739 RepID=C3XZP5_BRAFL|eukprot:XP_002610433.1 hypothetical protein BRAFLDRAFT_85572 [Branchiostoma floridae]
MMSGQASDVTTEGGNVISRDDVPDELMSVVTSLTSPRRYVPQWYVYDTRGSELCEQLLLWLGNSFSNVSIHDQVKMLQEIRAHLSDGDRLVLGVDMDADREALSRAYGDQWAPIWRDNLISRLNKDFDGNMDVEKFDFSFELVENPPDGDTPSYVALSLSSSCRQRVHFRLFGGFKFKRAEVVLQFHLSARASCCLDAELVHVSVLATSPPRHMCLVTGRVTGEAGQAFAASRGLKCTVLPVSPPTPPHVRFRVRLLRLITLTAQVRDNISYLKNCNPSL